MGNLFAEHGVIDVGMGIDMDQCHGAMALFHGA